MNRFLLKFVISFIFIFCHVDFTFAKTFVSLSPALTEIIYAIGAEKDLIGVSSECNYPVKVKQKAVFGNSYYINKEKLLNSHADYLLLAEGVSSSLVNFDKFGTKTIMYKMSDIDAVYETILSLGKLTGMTENSEKIVENLKKDILCSKTKTPKNILYLVQLNPLITIGKKAFISDVIKVSGQNSVTSGLDSFYPAVSAEYLLKLNPEVIVVSMKSDDTLLKKLFPKTKIIYLTKEQNDIINRPSSRINKAVRFFSEL